ncbi:MAG: DNA primase [Patescibacteria group bacterium]
MDAKDEIKQRLDLCDVIAEYIQLKPAGTHAMKAVCPFHSEKTPSFHVSRDKQIWRCFGCSLGGDMFSFVMQMEGVDFPEALRILGKKAGVEIQRFDTREANEKQRMQTLQGFATAFYNKVLRDASYAAGARAYVEKRGITPQLVEKFQLGFAPDDWDAFCKIAIQKGFTESDLLSGGLALRRKSGSGVIDRFRNRLMVPLSDVHGNVVGFTGRVMNPEDMPKYMNSPETPLYKKSQVLYGLDLAKQSIRKADRVILVEGNLDVVASHKADVENVVAASGTALTELQIDLLKRFTHNFVFCFDADAAGFAAAERGIQLAQSAGMNVAVVFIPEGAGKDPDEVVQKDPALWQLLSSKSIPIMEWYFNAVMKGKDLANVDDKKAVGAKLLPAIARIQDLIEREHWLSRLATALKIEADVLRKALPQKEEQRAKPQPKAKPAVAEELKKASRAELSAKLILAICLQYPELAAQIFASLGSELIPEGNLRSLYNHLSILYTREELVQSKSYYERASSTVPEPLQPLLEELGLHGEQFADGLTPKDARTQLETATDVLRGASHGAERHELLTAIRDAELLGDTTRAKELLTQLDDAG